MGSKSSRFFPLSSSHCHGVLIKRVTYQYTTVSDRFYSSCCEQTWICFCVCSEYTSSTRARWSANA